MGVENISANLHRIRKSRNLSMQELADKCEMSRVGYSNIENGKSQPKTSTLIQLSHILGVDIKDLLSQSPQFKSLRFRTHKTMTSQARNTREQIIFDVDRWLKDFNELENLLSVSNAGFPEIKEKEPRKLARELRLKLELTKDEPIWDILGLLEKRGLKFYLSSLALKSFFGFSIGEKDGGPAIVVNISDNISVERRIFTVAHELGHLLMHADSFVQEEDEEIAREEKEADSFAGFFLLPPDGFDKEWDDCRGLYWVDAVLHIKRKYRVSYKTVLHRLCSVHNQDSAKVYQEFSLQMKIRYGQSLKGHREPQSILEDNEPDPLSSHDFVEDRLHKLVREAYEKEKITLSRGAEILGLPMEEMRNLNNSWRDYY